MEERHLSLSEAADALNISERTAYRWIKSGKLRAYKPGRDYWIPESAIKEVVKESVVRPKAPRRSPSELTFNGLLEEERRDVLKNSYVEYTGKRADHYDQLLELAEQGGFFAGEEGARVLLGEALKEHEALFMLLAQDLADRRLWSPAHPAAVEAHVEATRILDRLTETLERMCNRLAELAETRAREEETERLREEISRRKQGIWNLAA
jgi:excisionase family DNA binding protein